MNMNKEKDYIKVCNVAEKLKGKRHVYNKKFMELIEQLNEGVNDIIEEKKLNEQQERQATRMGLVKKVNKL